MKRTQPSNHLQKNHLLHQLNSCHVVSVNFLFPSWPLFQIHPHDLTGAWTTAACGRSATDSVLQCHVAQEGPMMFGVWSGEAQETSENCSTRIVVRWLCQIVTYIYTYIYERPPKPPTIRNSYTRTLILDMIMKLSGTIGVTQKTMTFDIHVCLILNLKTFIQQVNIGMKSSLQEHPEAVCQK